MVFRSGEYIQIGVSDGQYVSIDDAERGRKRGCVRAACRAAL